MVSDKIFLIKVRTRRKLSDLMTALDAVSVVLSFREVLDDETAAPSHATRASHTNGTAVQPPPRRFVYRDPEADRVRRSKAMNEISNKRRAEVYPVLSEIMRRNQHCPLETLVNLMNETSVRPLRNGPWRLANIGPYVEYALARMTSPNETQPQSTVAAVPAPDSKG